MVNKFKSNSFAKLIHCFCQQGIKPLRYLYLPKLKPMNCERAKNYH